MLRKTIALIAALLLALPLAAVAQDEFPSVVPTMTVLTAEGDELEEAAYEGSAPVVVRLKANPEDLGSYTPYYEWRFTRQGEEKPFLVRYDEDTEYTFRQSGAFVMQLMVSFVQGVDTLLYEMDEPFVVTISESKMEVPNAFTPNGDGVNDVFRVKEGYQSIVEFKAVVLSRWGKKLHEWTDPADGWDGKSSGRDVPDGAYYLVINARGADGRKYDIKKTINLLRGYTEGSRTE